MARSTTFIILILLAVGVVLWVTISLTSERSRKEQIMHAESERPSAHPIASLDMVIVYDNNPHREDLEPAWGFACLVRGSEKTILFDTGGDGSILLANMKELGIDPDEIEVVVLSHIHEDHTGGLRALLDEKSGMTVYSLASFPRRFKADVETRGASIVEVDRHAKICENVYSTGELGTRVKEQALIMHTARGLIVMTGCAHPGIVHVVERAKDLIGEDVLLVIGGFHLGPASSAEIEGIVASIRELGVRYIAPCHCSGDAARELFHDEYEKNYIEVGVGSIITMEDLS